MGENTLEGWKAIAVYLNRSEATAKRWAREWKMPVKRTRTGRVMADPGELRRWFLKAEGSA